MLSRLALALLIAADFTNTAAAWLAQLDDEQRETVVYAFEDDERFDLRLAPIWLEGLRRDSMSAEQWEAWLAVLETTLSASGLEKVKTVITLEREVQMRDEQTLLGRWFGGLAHGEQKYYVAFFGEPGTDTPWGARFDGHHLSLNWTVSADGAISVTPVFLGGEPREVPAEWERGGLRVLSEEEDLGFALWSALDPEQRTRAELPFEHASGPAGARRPLFVGDGERVESPPLRGIARADLTPQQQPLLDALIDVYLANYAAPIQNARRARIDATGRDAIHFAWGGSLTPGDSGYYRVQGPTFLIEFDNTMREADHVHSLVRDFDGDFGRDLLADHYNREHTPTLASP